MDEIESRIVFGLLYHCKRDVPFILVIFHIFSIELHYSALSLLWCEHLPRTEDTLQ